MRSPEYFDRSHEMGDAFVESAHKKAELILNQNRVDLEDFDGFYPEAKLQADREYVLERKSVQDIPAPSFLREELARIEKAKKMSEITEAMIVDPKVIRAWYGFKDAEGKVICDVSATGTTELDDYANGLDAVWEMKHATEGYSNLALAVDVTFAAEFKDKLQYIKGDIEKGNLAKIEYFMPKWGDMKGEATQIPRVVIGVDAKNLCEVAPIWSRFDERRTEMEAHPMQKLILEEILYQLPVYEKYARKIGEIAVAEKILITKQKFAKLYELTLQKIPSGSDFVDNDLVFRHLREYLDKFEEMPSKVATGALRAKINAKYGI
jgi:hypothetical protein